MTTGSVAVLGAGSWGSAIAMLLGRAAEVRLWAREPQQVEAISRARRNEQYLPGIDLPDNVRPTSSLVDAVAGAEVVVYAIPSAGMPQVAREVAPHLPAGAVLVNAGKGLEEGTGRRLSEVILASLTGSSADAGRVAALSGPNLAMEVARRLPTASVAASSCLDTARYCTDLFVNPHFRVYPSEDIIGVELAGAMKNVIAMGAGVSDGMGFGDNSRAALMTRGLAEITRLGIALGAQPSTFLGLAGVGDLIATGGSRLSRNYRVGFGLGQGRPLETILAELGQVAEGVPTTRAICTLATQAKVEMPVSEALYAIVIGGAPPGVVLASLMHRPQRDCE